MIVTTLQRAKDDLSSHPELCEALEVLHRTDLDRLPPGIHEIDGKRLYLNVIRADGRGRRHAALEAHRQYLDIHFTLTGDEWIGWRRRSECENITRAYDAEDDVELFSDDSTRWVHTPPGTMGVFFPDDAHAPMGGEGPIHKIVAKIRIENEQDA